MSQPLPVLSPLKDVKANKIDFFFFFAFLELAL